MRSHIVLTVFLSYSMWLSGFSVAQDGVATPMYAPVLSYDPTRDAAQDLRDAQAEAGRTGRNVLVEVGGTWCIWCRIMDKFFEQHPNLAVLREKNFVTVAVNFGPENQNKAVLGRYPKIPGYPHLFVLNADGQLLRSQRTRDLEEGNGYNAKQFEKFLETSNQATTLDSSPEQSEEGTTLTNPSEDSVGLERVKTKQAEYPRQAAREGIQGQVWVKLMVSEKGDVESVEVISGNPILAKAAVDAVKKWKFKPAIKDGKAIKTSTKIPFDFYFSGKLMDKGKSADRTADSNLLPTPKIASSDAASLPSGVAHSSSNPDARDAPELVRVSAGVAQGMILHQIAPVYPESARRDHIQGSVMMEAVIGKDGRIHSIQPISGPKELIPAAVGAVQQWRYKPDSLQGQPVEVKTIITVNFHLSY